MRCSRKRIYPDLVSAPKIREAKEGQLITPMGVPFLPAPVENADGQYQQLGRNNLGVVSINSATHCHPGGGRYYSFLRHA